MLAQIQKALHDIAQLQLECQALESDNVDGVNSSRLPGENGFKHEPLASWSSL